MERSFQEGPFGPSVLAFSVVSSPLFRLSDAENEREHITAECRIELDSFALVAYLKDYVTGGQPRAGEALPTAVGNAWESALEELERALQLQVAAAVIEALEMIGVTDEGTKAEICRCVIKGGLLFDGRGFMEGRPVTETPPAIAAKPAEDSTPDEEAPQTEAICKAHRRGFKAGRRESRGKSWDTSPYSEGSPESTAFGLGFREGLRCPRREAA